MINKWINKSILFRIKKLRNWRNILGKIMDLNNYQKFQARTRLK